MTIICAGGDWQSDALRMIENYSRTWGGDAHGLIACSEHWDVHEAFWPLATEWDADHWAVFFRTLRGLRMGDPDAYERWLDEQAANWIAHHQATETEARTMFGAENYLSEVIGGTDVPDEINDRIRDRLAPLSFSAQAVVTRAYKADEAPQHGFVDMCQLTYRPKRVCNIDHSAVPMPVRLLVAASTGELGPGHLAKLQEEANFEHYALPATDADVVPLLEFAWSGRVDTLVSNLASAISGSGERVEPPEYTTSGFIADTPFVQARLGCVQASYVRARFDDQPVVVVAGYSADDFCYAFTRRQMTRDTYWLPTGPEPADAALHRTMLETLMKVLNSYVTSPTGNRLVLLSSLTLTTAELDALLVELATTLWGRHLNGGGLGDLQAHVCSPHELPVRRNNVLLDGTHLTDSLSEPFIGDELARDLEIPLPSEAVGLRPDSLRWQVDVEAAGHVLPVRTALQSLLTTENEGQWAARSSKNGISIDSHGRTFSFTGASLSQLLVRVQLRYPRPEEIFKTLLAPAGATLEESDKGRYTRRMLELWGGFDALAADLLTGTPRTLLDHWITPKGENRPGICIQSRRYLRLSDVVTVTSGTEEDSRVLLDRYLQRGIASRGLIFQCALCGATAFYRLEEIGPGFKCWRCRQPNEITRPAWKGGEEPEFFYELDEVAYLGIAANIHVPVLALAEAAKGSRSFLQMPEAVVHRPGKKDIEIDLWAIIDGCIVVGEAKKSDHLERNETLERTRCDALKDIVTAMTADQFLMASAEPAWAERTRAVVASRLAPAIPVRWLNNLN